MHYHTYAMHGITRVHYALDYAVAGYSRLDYETFAQRTVELIHASAAFNNYPEYDFLSLDTHGAYKLAAWLADEADDDDRGAS